MPDPLSRRGLFSFAWAKATATRPDVSAYRRVVRERWDDAGPLLAALAPLAGPLCDAAMAGADQRVLVVAAGDGQIALEAARRGAVVTACEHAEALLEEAEERTGGLDVAWDSSDADDLPYFDGAFDAVIAGPGATFLPRPVRVARELLRVLAPGGMLVLGAPPPGSFLADALELAIPQEGIAGPGAWGRVEVVHGRLDTAEPGVHVEMRDVGLELEFESEAAAWEACSGPLGLPPDARERFAGLVAARSASLPAVRIDDLYTLALACRR